MEALQKMRNNFLFKFKNADEDDLHSVPIQDMGNYHEYLKNQAPPLREIETQLVRQHMFGNPFKLVSKDQKSNMFGADEIDEVYEESAENNNQFNPQQRSPTPIKRSAIGGPASKRKGGIKGPLSKRVNYLKNLYNTNANSSNNSSINDSDIELLDETSSNASTAFTMASNVTEDVNPFDKQNNDAIITNDIANLSDFNDFSNDVEMQIFDQTRSSSFMSEQVQLKQDIRPVSSSSSSSLSNSNEAEFNLISSSNSLCDNYLEQSYIHLKILCIEQIKKPGKDHSRLFQLIHDSQLTLRMRQFLIKELIYEASRFKRYHLIQLLMKFSSILQSMSNNNNATPNIQNAQQQQKQITDIQAIEND